jgi:hypothetical protein
MFNVLIFRSVLIGSAVIDGGGVLFAATNPAPVAGSNTNPAYPITSPVRQPSKSMT